MSVGDFAILLNAGMSVKQALVYNFASALPCIMGTVVGVAVGNISSATSWIFAFIAGLFLYIALVDMVATYLLWPPYGIGQAIIFLPCDFYVSSSFFLA